MSSVRWVITRFQGIVVPVAATVLAFLIGGLVVAATGHNPLTAYRAIFNGTGLNYLFPWTTEQERVFAAINLQQTLIIFTPLVFTALAVAFAFRCGMFNIGGQGQYWVGLMASLWVGSNFESMGTLPHVLLAMIAAVAAGAIWGGLAGLMKAVSGAHEVISTIMLNWIAIFGGKYLYELGGPLQGPEPSIPRSDAVVESGKLPAVWGVLQPLHAGVFLALLALVVYWVLINRTTLGYEVRAVGHNPEAAAYGGINVSRNQVLALAISGAFAGMAGAMDILGWQFAIATNVFDVGQLGFIGIAVALLGRNGAVGILFSALLFAGLQVGTSTRQLDPSVFPPELATNLATIIQGLIILFVGAEFLIVLLWRRSGGRFWRRGPVEPVEPTTQPKVNL
jgi:general nucleoside transport system permease protein